MTPSVQISSDRAGDGCKSGIFRLGNEGGGPPGVDAKPQKDNGRGLPRQVRPRYDPDSLVFLPITPELQSLISVVASYLVLQFKIIT